MSEEVKNVNVHTAKGLLSTGYKCLDVRTKEDHDKGHVDGAINVPYVLQTEEGRTKNPDFLAQVSEICKKEDLLVVACNRGGGSLKATIDLQHAGFQHVNNMEGGYCAWVDAGFARHY